MARTPWIPLQLTQGPFSLDEARAAGLTLSALRGDAWRRLGAELYCWKGLQVTPWQLLSAWERRLPPDAVFAGGTAGWLSRLDLEPADPVEVVVPPSSGLRSRAGLSVRRCELPASEVVRVRGMRATALPRTLADLCLTRPPVDALIAIDMAVRSGLADAAALSQYAAAANGRPGISRLRSLAALAAPAESPMETRMRWHLVQARLPRPEVQVNLYDGSGRFVGRADLYYPAARLVIEFDGGNHRDRLVEDDRRQNLLVSAGFLVLRFTAADLLGRPDVVIAQVRAALAAAGAIPHVGRQTRARERRKGRGWRQKFGIGATARSLVVRAWTGGEGGI